MYKFTVAYLPFCVLNLILNVFFVITDFLFLFLKSWFRNSFIKNILNLPSVIFKNKIKPKTKTISIESFLCVCCAIARDGFKVGRAGLFLRGPNESLGSLRLGQQRMLVSILLNY